MSNSIIKLRRDVPLNLDTLWYAHKPPAFPPPSIISLGILSAKITKHDRQERKEHNATHLYITALVRWLGDLSITEINLWWLSNEPRASLQMHQQHYPPPTLLNNAALDAASQTYGQPLARWAESHRDKQVGDGNARTLAREGLLALHEEDRRTEAHEPVFVTKGRVHGHIIGEHMTPKGTWSKIGTRPSAGDMIEFIDAAFVVKVRDQNGKVLVQRTMRRQEHTAILLSSLGTRVWVLEQGIDGRTKVEEGEYDFLELTQGKMVFYRPVAQSKLPPLEAGW
jgi:hypothetical protein